MLEIWEEKNIVTLMAAATRGGGGGLTTPFGLLKLSGRDFDSSLPQHYYRNGNVELKKNKWQFVSSSGGWERIVVKCSCSDSVVPVPANKSSKSVEKSKEWRRDGKGNSAKYRVQASPISFAPSPG